MFLLYLTSLTVILLAGSIQLYRITLRRCMDLADWFVVGLIAYGGFGVFFVAVFLDAGVNEGMRAMFEDEEAISLYPIACFLSIAGVWIAQSFFSRTKRSIYIKETPAHLSHKAIRKFIIFASMFLTVGVISYWVYTRPYGGFLGILRYSQHIRAGLLEELGIDNPYSFLKRFGAFSFFSSLIFFSMIFCRNKIYAVISLIGFIFSLFFSVYILYSWEGRLALIAYILSFPLAFLFLKKGMGGGSFFRASLLVLVPIFILPSSSGWWGKSDEMMSVGRFFVKELSFPLISFYRNTESPQYQYMADIVKSPLFLLPKRIWKEKLGIEAASARNTRIVTGEVKGKDGFTAEAPIDFVSFAYMQLAVLGLFLTGFVYGSLFIFIDRWITSRSPNLIGKVLLAYAAISISLISAVYADPQAIIIRNFHYIVGCISIAWIYRRYRRRMRRLYYRELRTARLNEAYGVNP